LFLTHADGPSNLAEMRGSLAVYLKSSELGLGVLNRVHANVFVRANFLRSPDQ